MFEGRRQQYNRRSFLKAAAGAALAAPMINRGSFRLFANTVEQYSTRTLDIVQRSTVIDMLGLLTLDFPKLYSWQLAPQTFQAADYKKLKASGITVFHPAVGYDRGDVYAESLRDMACWNNFLSKQSDYFMRVAGPADFGRAKAEGKIGILLGEQNSEHFRSLDDVNRFYRLGQRVSQLTYRTNQIGGGAFDQHDPGLSDFGASVIERMSRLGMAVDVSHCGDRTTLDAFEASYKPVLITHSNCRALVPNRSRCKTDEAIRKMASTGGVMGVTMVRSFVKAAGPATMQDVLSHIDRIVRLAGVEHVGVGSDVDLDGRCRLTPAVQRAQSIRPGSNIDLDGVDYQRKIFDLTEALVRRSYSDKNIQLILGGNFERALTEIWTTSPA